MPPKLPPVITVTGIRGRNGSDAPHLVPEDQCVEALNVEFYEGGICKKRGGEAAHGTTSLTTKDIFGLFRHVPGASQAAAEFWTFAFESGSAAIKRMAAGTTWATITPAPADALSFGVNTVNAVSFNGKLFVAADSSIGGTPLNRLHCWDGTTFRRVGLATPGTPTATEAAGAVTDVRKYKTSACIVSGGVVVYRSELSAASSAYTLSAENATITFVGAPGEGETHWELWIGSDDDNYATYRLSQRTAIATTTAVDAQVDLTELTTFAPPVGTNQLPPSCKYLATDGNRLLMAGAYESSAATGETTPKNNRVWFTPVLGTSDVGDDERVSHTTTFKGWVDVGENDGDTITGLGVLNGVVYVFKNERLYRLRPTGDAVAPYIVEEVSKAIGAASHQSITVAEDGDGNAALYFWSRRGPYRASASGLDYVGRDVEDYSLTIAESQVSATWGLFYPAKRQIYFQIATASGASNMLVLDVRSFADGRGGWSRMAFSNDTAFPYCAALFSNTPGASMSSDLKPWIAGADGQGDPSLKKWDTGTYSGQAYVDTKVYAPTSFREPFAVKPPTLVAEVSSGVTITASLYADYHATADASGTTLLTSTALPVGASAAAGTETHVINRIDALEYSGARAFKLRIGDGSALSSAWTLDQVTIPIEVAS